MYIHLDTQIKPTFSYTRKFFFFLLSFHMTILTAMPLSSSESDVEDALLRLKQSFNSTAMLSSWDPSQPPCFGNMNNWVGVICSNAGSVYGVRLENMRLSGEIDIDALLSLPRLRSISLMDNEFRGPLPEIKKLKALKSVYLSNNKFEGVIDPDAFDGLNRLTKVHLANNNFVGQIPSSLTGLPRMIELRLEGNRFSGSIPDFKQGSFIDLSLAYNELDGPIPAALSDIRVEAFAGNKGLCEMPLEPCESDKNTNRTVITSSPPAPWPPKRAISIIPIIVAAAIVVFVVLIAIALIIRKRNPKREKKEQKKLPIRDAERGNNVNKTKAENGKLCFMRDEGQRFDLPDLMKSSAEILGSGCFGASYKTCLGSSMMVVKRFKQMNNVDKEEFQEHMRRLGRLEHQNLLSLVAYNYRKEEKLLVAKYVPKGSLALRLHGNQRGQLTLDWPTRLKVIKGVVRGLSYLYKELPSLIAPHGHLKSSNVLLDESFNPWLNDYGLIPLINQENSQQLMVAYKSPEYIKHSRINKKTDIWSLGILIIEIITGEFPAEYLQQGSHRVDLSSWVQGVVGEDIGIHVFDKNMAGSTKFCETEILKLLRIGLSCCEYDVEKRCDIKEACERIEEIKEKDEDDFYSSYASDGDRGSSSRAMSDEFTFVPMT